MNYWEKRALEREEGIFLQSQEVIDKVKNSYYRISQNIKKEIELLQNKLNTLENITISDIEAYNFRQNLLKELEQRIFKEYSYIIKEEIIETENFYKYVIENTYNSVVKDFNISFSLLNKDTIEDILKTKWLGSNYSNRIWGNTTVLANELSNILLDGIVSGRTLSELTSEIERIMKVGAYSAERLIRTEMNYFHNQSAIQAYLDYGITRYQFLATIDGRTSEICTQLNGRVFNTKDAQVGKNYPPMHPFCRSTTIAYFEELKEDEQNGIIEENNKDKDNIEVHTVGKLENKIYKERYKDLITDEVIITDNQIEHIKQRRGEEFYDKYKTEFENIINNPDYIFEDNSRKNTLIVCKKIKQDDKYINIVLRLAINVQHGYKNSIITAIGENQRRFEQRIRNNLYIYKKE